MRGVNTAFVLLVALSPTAVCQVMDTAWGQALLKAEELRREGKYAEAEPVLTGLLTEMEELGPQDPWLIATQNNLCVLYRELGRYSEGEAFCRRALAALEKIAGTGDPHLYRSLNNLAILYLESGQYGKAEGLIRRSLALSQAQSDDSVDVLRILMNLASLQEQRRKYTEAESLYREVLETWRRRYGEDKWEVAMLLNNLGGISLETGRLEDARSHFERALAIWEKLSGPAHPDLVAPLKNLGDATFFLGRYGESEAAATRALAIAEEALGPQHHLVGHLLRLQAAILHKTGRKPAAKKLEQRARIILEQHRRRNGSPHVVDISELHHARR